MPRHRLTPFHRARAASPSSTADRPRADAGAGPRTRPLAGAIVAAILAAAAAVPAAAQDGPNGIAIAAAPEAGFHACHGDNADQTLACARRKCEEADAGGACLRVRWCFPAGYSGAMSYLANRTVTETTFVCGAPSLPALGSMLAAFCNAEGSASECRLMAVWDPSGAETERSDLLGKNTTEDAASAPSATPAPATMPILPQR